MLKQRRNEAKVTKVYKVLNNLVFVDHDLQAKLDAAHLS